MFNKKLKVVLLLCSLTIIFVSCNSDNSNNSSLEQNKKLKIEKISIEKKNGDCEKKNSKNCVMIKIEFPKLTQKQNENAVNKINENIRLQLLQPILDEGEYNSLDSLISSIFDEYNSVIKEYPESGQNWEIERLMKIKTQTDNILSIEYSDYSFLGGAHPNNFVSYSNYYLATGEEIPLDECFQKDYENQLNSIAEKIFKQQKKLSMDSDLSSAGYWFDEDKFELNDNFAVLKNGLLFYFNSYEIAPYALGPTELVIPYSEIDQLILADGPLSNFIKN